MDLGYVALIAIVFTLLLLMIQRVERPRRRMAACFLILCSLIIRHNAFLKRDLHEETLLAFALGLLASGLFWLLIGRYNPPGSSDSIRVLDMND